MIRIIKLGGCVITRDSADRPFDVDNTARLARELAPFAAGTVLVHGTGHVGKPFAVEHGFLQDGFIAADRKLLAAKIRTALRRLNVDVVDTLCAAGIPACGMQPAHCFDESMQDIRFAGFPDELREQLDRGIVPVFFGDLMPLSDGAFKVFSSDRIVALLAACLHPEQVIFLSNVPGVFGRDENGQRANEPLHRMTPGTQDQAYRDESDLLDVSGGMR